MAASEMYDFLTTISPDVDQTLSITAQGSISEDGDFNQDVHIADDGSEERVSLATSPIFYAEFGYNALIESEIGTIHDLYFNTSKANGVCNSFKWTRGDGHTYVVRFDCKLTRAGQHQSRMGIKKIRLRVLGRIAD